MAFFSLISSICLSFFRTALARLSFSSAFSNATSAADSTAGEDLAADLRSSATRAVSAAASSSAFFFLSSFFRRSASFFAAALAARGETRVNEGSRQKHNGQPTCFFGGGNLRGGHAGNDAHVHGLFGRVR